MTTTQLVLRIDADVVDQHLLRELGGGVGIFGPVAAYGDVQDDEEWVVEDPASAFGPFGLGEGGVIVGVHVKADDAGFPLCGIHMKIIGVLFTAWKWCAYRGVGRRRNETGGVE